MLHQTIRRFIFSICLLFIFCYTMAQQHFNYDTAWKKVETFIDKGLPKSALDEIKNIYDNAKGEKQEAQQVKALVYQSQLVMRVEENEWVKNINTLESDASIAAEPVKQILNSILADLYYSYFQNQRYKIYNRTATVNFKKDDPETWSITDYHAKITALYEASLLNTQLLQATKLDKYDPIITKGNMRRLRPTLFDLLAWKALNYFKSDERDITKPAYAFELKDQISLSPASTFINYNYTSKDSSSLQLKAIKIYQQILAFHQSDANKAAFIDADIDRLIFTYNKNVIYGKEKLYKESLEQILNIYGQMPEATQAGYLLAQWWYSKGNTYKPGIGTQEDKYAIKKAIQICESIKQRFPESEGSINAANLLTTLRRPGLNMQLEKVNVPDQPFRSLIQFKNINQLHLRIVRITEDIQKSLYNSEYYNDERYWKKLISLSYQKKWKQNFPEEDDYRQHSAEIKIDALPVGKYALLTSVDENFSLEENPLSVAFFYVSNISFVHNGTNYYILNRDNGLPLANASVQVWHRKYNYDDRKYRRIKGELKTTDKNGYVKLKEDKQDRYTFLEITYNNDRLALDDEIYMSESNNYYGYNDKEIYVEDKNSQRFEEKNVRYFFFSDRSIYRPGQIVYFKAIGITKDINTFKSKLFVPKDSVEVELKNANYQKVESIKLNTNEYGSVFGQFRLPENTLNGRFSLSIKNNFTYSFSVEEYKRPKFYVDYERIKGSYRVNDRIKVIGTAKAYAGNNIDGAAVKYRVYRNTRFLYPWLFWRYGIWNYNSGSRMEITHGETTTNTEGKFDITFEAIPDLSVSKDFDPTFDYTIEADITDINGETRSGSTAITVAYKALQLSISVPKGETLPTDSLKNIILSTTNMSGEFETAKTNVKIYELATNDRLLRKRYWSTPDTTVMSYNDFIKYFPYDPYQQENDYRTWNKGRTILSDTFTTQPNSTFNIQHAIFQSGWYVIEATATDKYGEEIRAIEYVQLYDQKSNRLPSKQYAWSHTIQSSGEPGERAKFITGTSADNLFVVQEVIKPQNDQLPAIDRISSINTEYLKLNNQLVTTEFPITEADRGNYGVRRFFIKHNRFYSDQWQIYVPWSNKNLDISFETFRDKLLPGQEEKWKVKIKGHKGEKVAAEMLASMYDASLDQFQPHHWYTPDIWPYYSFYNQWESSAAFNDISSSERYTTDERSRWYDKRYDELFNISGYYAGRNYDNIRIRGMGTLDGSAEMMMPSAPVLASANKSKEDKPNEREEKRIATISQAGLKDQEENAPPPTGTQEDLTNVHVRSNLQETAFFFPDLHTDADGNITFSFTMPEALTQWKIQTLAHTKDLSSGITTKTTVTQKDLMVQPNAPRFFREGDRLVLSAKISNLTDKALSGQAQLQLFDANTNKPVDTIFKNSTALQGFTVPAGQSIAVKFPMEVPVNYGSALTYRIVAKAGAVSDGEENAAPVLTNRMMVTESFPLNLRNTNNKKFIFEKLLNSEKSETLTSSAVTVEFTTNPVWYAVQSLPYLMEYPYECVEQTMNRFYANALATKIANSTPKIKAIFEQWKTQDTTALLSNLEKNQELKSALLEETPWVMDAQNESKQKKNIALLFNMIKMTKEIDKAITKVKSMQVSNGGFTWFKGGPDDRYMTQYIITSIGHLKKLGAWPDQQKNDLTSMVTKAIPYLDARIKEDYDYIIKYAGNIEADHLSSIAIQYLYMRSFFNEYPIAAASIKAVNYFTKQSQKYWLHQSKYEQGMIALALYRKDDQKTPMAILKSLKENSINNEEFGMYWKDFNTGGYYWYQAPIESHALLIETFSEIGKNTNEVDDLKTWLLKQKQTQNWRTTKATAEACYALLLQGNNWINAEKNVTIKLGNYTISNTDANVKAEAGTGYFKQRIEGNKVKSNMGNISVALSSPQGGEKEKATTTTWGAVYWQYFENLDKITSAATPLSLNKKLFVEKNTDHGPVLQPVNDGDEVKIGDKIKVRIELRVDRNMEYVHMKDMRAACLEPTNVLSQYKYQDGLGYYESTKDASTNFFFSYLNKGTYVFEYPLMVTNSGNFSNGITTIQCMYAPEFTSHCEGIRLQVK